MRANVLPPAHWDCGWLRCRQREGGRRQATRACALGQGLAPLAGSVDVHISHIKPGKMKAVMAQIGRLGTGHRIHALAAGQAMRIG